MSLISDLSRMTPVTALDSKVKVQESSSSSLDFDDYLQLMVAMFSNQDPENAASTTDMMNMLVQMTTVEAMTNMTDATTMMYTASLVGKDVTVGKYASDGGLEEIYGIVTGTGTYGGKPIIFVDGVSYYLSDIMAVGKLPPKETDETETSAITIAKSENGAITALPEAPKADDLVTVTAVPNDGYKTVGITVTDADKNELKVTNNDDGTFSFTYTGSPVTIEAEFESTTPDDSTTEPSDPEDTTPPVDNPNDPLDPQDTADTGDSTTDPSDPEDTTTPVDNPNDP